MAEAIRRGIETEIATAPCRETRQRSGSSPRQELWEINGRPAGRDLDFWLQAERKLIVDDQQGGADQPDERHHDEKPVPRHRA